MVDRRFWADALRNAKGLAETGRMIVQPMVGDIPAGLTGLGSMMLGEDQDTSAARVRQVQDQFAYTPSEDARPYVDALGKGIDWAGRKLKQLPGAERAQQGWEDFTVAAPGAAAITAAVVGAGVPESRGARGAGRAIDAAEEARLAALRQVRETTPAGPVFVSAVEETIPKLQPKGTVAQYVATLRNKPGIKGEELDDLNLGALDPNATMTNDEFLALVKSRRPERSVYRQSYAELDPDVVAERIDENTELALRSAAHNLQSYENLGLNEFIPFDQHPAQRSMLHNKNRREAWSKDPARDELWGDALELAIEEMEAGNRTDTRMARTFMDDPEDERAMAYVHDYAMKLLDRAIDDPKTYQELRGYNFSSSRRGIPDEWNARVDADWAELNKKYGDVSKGIGETEAAMFLKQLEEHPAIREHVRAKTQAEIMADPSSYRWPRNARAPEYGYMTYYENFPDPGYIELLEQQGPLPDMPDTRPYAEPHWTGPGPRNNVTMHLRLSGVETPEGNPALFMNELQSKYAATAGERGTTRDPLELAPLSAVNDATMRRIEELIGNPDVDLGNSWAAHELDSGTYDMIENLREIHDDLTKEDVDKRLAQIRQRLDLQQGNVVDEKQQSYLVPSGEDPLTILHRGEPFNPIAGGSQPAVTFPNTPEGRAAAEARIKALQAGKDTSRDTLNPDPRITPQKRPKFANDPRLPPKAGLKTWRLRGLKMALREAADRGMNDLYFPTGQMMPRIEKWVPDAEEFSPEYLGPGDNAPPLDYADVNLRNMAEGFQEDNLDDQSFSAVMRNYDERLPKEWGPYLKKFGARIERAEMLPPGGEANYGATGQRIRFTPELLAEVLRGQKLYQLAGGAGLLGLLLANQQEQPQL